MVVVAGTFSMSTKHIKRTTIRPLQKKCIRHIVCVKLMDEPLFKAEGKKHNQIKYDYPEAKRTDETDYQKKAPKKASVNKNTFHRLI